MTKIEDANFMTKFPPALKRDKSMLTLGEIISKELHVTAAGIKKNIIYANIDTLSETWLDMLAYDLHVDWYDYDYPLETKKAIIKDSIKVHQKLGTKYAVETSLSNIFKDVKVSEWFEYGGKPYYFRIDIDTGGNELAGNAYAIILSKVRFCKNLRSHCDGIYISLNGGTAIVAVTAAECIGTTLKVKAKTINKLKTNETICVMAAERIGATLKIKPALTRQIQVRAIENIAARPSEASSLKIKAKTINELKVNETAHIMAAEIVSVNLKVKPVLVRQIKMKGLENTVTRILGVNSLKIKAKIPEKIKE
ncbi:MAG: phage tail protein I [Lachnospiraceae bacterium]|nr:phage tail protein I [Lachnospiraceae bacterium]